MQCFAYEDNEAKEFLIYLEVIKKICELILYICFVEITLKQQLLNVKKILSLDNILPVRMYFTKSKKYL